MSAYCSIHIDRHVPINDDTQIKEKDILDEIKKNQDGVNITRLIETLTQTYDPYLLKGKVWQMINSGKINLDSDRNLHIPNGNIFK